ncbi:MAG: hypothetical protein GY832_04370 [Chloroflexi bacterium]|nr:hypothetical protein [Chloroflexota bacterium]
MFVVDPVTRTPIPTWTPRPHPDQTWDSILASPVRLSQTVISPDTAEQVTRLAVLGLNIASYTNWSPDGKQFIAILPPYGIGLYDAQTMDLIRFIDIDVDQISALSNDWTLLATRADDDAIKLWDVLAEQELHTFGKQSAPVDKLALSPDGNLLALRYHSHPQSLSTINVWNIVTGRKVCTFSFEDYSSKLPLVFSPDGTLLASGIKGRTIKLWKILSGELDKDLTLENFFRVNSLAFSPDGRYLAVGGQIVSSPHDDAVSVWDVASGRKLHAYSNYYTADSVIFSSDGTLLAARSPESVRVWSVSNETEVFVNDSSIPPGDVSFSPDGKLLASGFFQWEIATGREVFTVTDKVFFGIDALHFSHDENLLTSVSGRKTIAQWAIPTARLLHMTQGGFNTGVHCSAFSPGKTILAWGPGKGKIELRRVPTGDLVKIIPTNAACQGNSAFSPDGKLLAVSTSHTVEVWDLVTGDMLYSFLQDIPLGMRGVAFSPTGRLLASWLRDGSIKLWEVSTGNEIFTPPGFPSDTTTATFSPDGTLLAIGLESGTVRLWDVVTMQELEVFSGHSDYVTVIEFSPDGNLIISGSKDETAKLWDISTGYEIHTLDGHHAQVDVLTFSSDGALLASAGSDTISLWGIPLTSGPFRPESIPTSIPDAPTGVISGVIIDASTGLPISGANVTTDPPTASITTDAEGKFLISDVPPGHHTIVATKHGYVSQDTKITIAASETATANFNLLSLMTPPTPPSLITSTMPPVMITPTLSFVLSGTLVPQPKVAISSQNVEQLVHLAHIVEDTIGRVDRLQGQIWPWGTVSGQIAWSPDSELFAISSSHGVYLFDVQRGQIRFIESNRTVVCLAFSPDGTLLVYGVIDGRIMGLEMPAGDEIFSLPAHTKWVKDLAFSPNGTLLVSVGGDKRIKFWDVSTMREVDALSAEPDDVPGLAFSTDGALLASTTKHNAVTLWETLTRRENHTFYTLSPGRYAMVNNLAFSPDGTLFATATGGTIKLWKVGTWQQVHTFSSHVDSVESVAFSPNGALLASVGWWDGNVRLWEVATGREIGILQQRPFVFDVAFSPDGTMLAVGMNGAVSLWGVSSTSPGIPLPASDE